MSRRIFKIYLIGFASLVLIIITSKLILFTLTNNIDTWRAYTNTQYGFSFKHPMFLGKNYVGLPADFSEDLICNNENHPPILIGMHYENYKFIYGSTNCDASQNGKMFSLYVLDINKKLREDYQMEIDEQQLGNVDIESQIKNTNDPDLKYIKLSSDKYLIAVNGSTAFETFKRMVDSIKVQP